MPDSAGTSKDYDHGDYLWDYYADYYNIDFPEKDAADIIYIYISPFLLLLGTVGNLLSLFVMQRLSRQVLSTCFYLCLMSVIDLLVLFTRCGNEWLTKVSHFDLSNALMVSTESVCKVYPFVFNFIFHLSKWLMVCVAVEGFIATKYPEKADRMCCLPRARAIVLFLTVILSIVNIHYFWSYELIFLRELHDPNAYFCTFAKHGHVQSEYFQEVIWPVLDLMIAEILPYCVVIVCASVMLLQITKGRHRGDLKHQRWMLRYQLHPAAMNELQLTILCVCVIYVVLTLPQFINSLFTYLVNKYDLLPYTFRLEAKQILANAVCGSLDHLFLSCKFIVYFSSSRKFRKECKKLLFRCSARNSRSGQEALVDGSSETNAATKLPVSSNVLL